MRVVVTGGAGYVGHKLVPALVIAGHQVTVFDTMWFGWHIGNHPNLVTVQGDIRDTSDLPFWGQDAVIHMACISNDPSVELDESLSRTINYECFEPMVLKAKSSGVKRFIYCSTSSVYGLSDAPDVTEDHPHVPLTLYNTYKSKCEPLLLKHQSDDFTCTVLRPSTICGYSPRQRLDLAVNILTNLAVNTGEIIVHGGEQKRPNLHIDDMVAAYMAVLDAPPILIQGQTFNVGAKNHTINELAEIVRSVVPAEIRHTSTVDHRSYQVNSDKIARVLGFVPRRTVEDAVRDLVGAFRDGLLPDSLADDRYFNVKRMRKVWADVYKDAPPLAVDPVKGHLSEIDVLHR